jgi:hypothetical protein
MTVLRAGDELTLVNTVRLDDRGLDQLEKLGRVSHLVRLGSFHGMDDAFYRERYGARHWALPGMPPEGIEPDELLTPGGREPFADLETFSFRTSKQPEGLLRHERDGGILISCDSLQNWTEIDPFFDEASAVRMQAMGFIKAANIGPGWRGSAEPSASDFARVKELAFRHLLPGHGRPLRDTAHLEFATTFEREYSV